METLTRNLFCYHLLCSHLDDIGDVGMNVPRAAPAPGTGAGDPIDEEDGEDAVLNADEAGEGMLLPPPPPTEDCGSKAGGTIGSGGMGGGDCQQDKRRNQIY